jgi:hypothetical protein
MSPSRRLLSSQGVKRFNIFFEEDFYEKENWRQLHLDFF